MDAGRRATIQEVARSVLVITGRVEVAEAFRKLARGRFQVAFADARRPLDSETGARHSVVVVDVASVPQALVLGRRLRAHSPFGEFLVVVEDDRAGVEAMRGGAFDYVRWPVEDEGSVAVLLDACLRSVGGVDEAPLPEFLGGCRRERRLAVGGMAEIFLATRPSDGESVVLKVLRPEFTGQPDLVDMFLTEAKLSTSLQHKNIVRVLDSGLDEGRFFLTLEYVDGHDLETLGSACGWQVPAKIACHIAAEVAAALGYAHSRTDPDGRPMGIIHRDVNPPNILLSRTGEVKLTDFGIAKSSQRVGQTASGVLKGKIDYMSPEQLLGQTVDFRADLFALGSVLHQLLSGTHPFRAPTTLQTIQAIKKGGLPRPSEKSPRIPAALDPVLARVLARDVSARYRSAGELEADLRRFIAAAGGVSLAEMSAFVKAGLERRSTAKLTPAPEAPDRLPPGVVPRPGVTGEEAPSESEEDSGTWSAGSKSTDRTRLSRKPPRRGLRAALVTGAILLVGIGLGAAALWMAR